MNHFDVRMNGLDVSAESWVVDGEIVAENALESRRRLRRGYDLLLDLVIAGRTNGQNAAVLVRLGFGQCSYLRSHSGRQQMRAVMRQVHPEVHLLIPKSQPLELFMCLRENDLQAATAAAATAVARKRRERERVIHPLSLSFSLTKDFIQPASRGHAHIKT